MKKKVIVILIILVIIASVGIGGYFIYQRNKQQDPFELEWVRIYYDYMRESHEALKENQNGLKYYREDEKIEFCKIENIKNPVMIYNYKELGVTLTNIFYISDNNEVKLLKSFKKDFEVEYLYDIESQIYEYYAHETYSDKESYTKISESINANEETENTSNILTFGIGEKASVTTLDGQVLEISKFDQKFIETNVVKDNWKDINFDNYEDAIKKDFCVAVRNMENVLTEEIREGVSKKEGAILSKKEEMIKAIQKIEQKEEEKRKIAEEEARIKAEEEAKKKAEEEAKKAEEEAKKKAEEEAKKAEEEAKKREEGQNGQEQAERENRKLHIKIWNI